MVLDGFRCRNNHNQRTAGLARVSRPLYSRRYFIAAHHEISWPRDKSSELSDRFDIRKVSHQQSTRCGCQISEQYNYSNNLAASRIRENWQYGILQLSEKRSRTVYGWRVPSEKLRKRIILYFVLCLLWFWSWLLCMVIFVGWIQTASSFAYCRIAYGIEVYGSYNSIVQTKV